MNNKLLNIFCALVLYDYNIRILHWKTCGLDFGTKHLLMDDYHSQLNSYTDEISEILMMTGNTDIPTFDQIIEIIKEDDEEDYIILDGDVYFDASKIISTTKLMFDHLIKLYYGIISDEKLPSDIISVLEEHLYWIRKESSYKLRSHLVK